MIDKVIGTGRTVEDAVNDGLTQLAVTKEEVEVKIIQEPTTGVLGLFGKKEAIVELTLLDLYNPEKIAFDFLTEIMEAMDVACEIDTHLEEGVLNVEFSGPKMGILIGRRGQTLDSLQYLTGLVVNKGGDSYTRVILDTENYREKRKKTLENLADKIAAKAIRYRKKMILEPMDPYERRIIHSHLQDHDKVYTYSEGEDPYRKVVVMLKDERR